MTGAQRPDIWSDGGDRDPSGPPLLHLRGTEYGLRMYGLRLPREPDQERATAAMSACERCGHGQSVI